MARKPRDFRIQKCTPFYVKGRGYQYRVSVTGKTGGGKAEPDFLERVAYDNACKLRDELLSGKKQPTGETFDEFRARIVPGLGWAPSTGKLKDYGYNKWTKSILGPIPVSEINRTKIIYWLTWMRENGATEGVCHAQYWAVHKLLRDAFREDLIAKVPDCADQVKTPEPRDGIALDPDMLPRILALIPPQLTTIPLVQAATGARIGEVLALQQTLTLRLWKYTFPRACARMALSAQLKREVRA
jgi:hypothetical protein